MPINSREGNAILCPSNLWHNNFETKELKNEENLKHLRSEKEIMQNWQGKVPIVSICCITYNHESYIEETLEGFLIQHTDFPFEILIHDDASTDKTADIIREYEQKYPNITKPIYQTKNQYSQGAKINSQFNFPRAKGRYIALCEGDDYWTDKDKLQMQVDGLTAYPGINMCFHFCSVLNRKEERINPDLSALENVYSVYSDREIIESDFHFVETNTIVFRKEALQKLDRYILSRSPVGDVWIRLAASLPNGALCVNKVMSTYRSLAAGSWGDSMRNGDAFLTFVEKMMWCIDKYDEYWGNRYSSELRNFKNKFINAVVQHQSVTLREKAKFVMANSSGVTLRNRSNWVFLLMLHALTKPLRVFMRYLRNCRDESVQAGN